MFSDNTQGEFNPNPSPCIILFLCFALYFVTLSLNLSSFTSSLEVISDMVEIYLKISRLSLFSCLPYVAFPNDFIDFCLKTF